MPESNSRKSTVSAMIEENFWPTVSVLLAVCVFYVSTVAGEQSAMRVAAHESKVAGEHPVLEGRVSDNKTAIALVKNDIGNIKDDVADIKKQQENARKAQDNALAILQSINERIPRR